MKPSEYIQKALRTESGDYKFKGLNGVTPRMEHAVMGIVTEAGELMDDVKRAKIYSQQVDEEHLKEEAGDVMWYLALLCDAMDSNFEELWEKNIAKLKVRYPEKYTDEKAIKRNVRKESKVFTRK